MLDGIEHYPKRRRKIKIFPILVVLILIIGSAAGYWFLVLNKNTQTEESHVIVISEPKVVIELNNDEIRPIKQNNNANTQEKSDSSLRENLDEIILIKN
jgi:flagellar basal body-associated protein FliL